MKDFFVTWMICFILLIIFLVFGGSFILENFWASVSLVAVVIATLITTFISQDTKIEQLEARIQALEAKDVEKNKEILPEGENQ